jgi:lipopolysaccharide transport system ATP-binding protein
MSDTVIRIENLGKKYIIGRSQERERYTALRDVIANSAKGLVGRFKHPKLKSQHSNSEEFWALKDISLDINQGDRVGIIGRNGAGKSTLLKILSRITEPTTGYVELKGRVASLLEVGTGFHPELTGKENIFLNGAILGMGKAEISRKFDEIVAFAGVERFLGTPVKHYSSGMYVRLAFAVAAHLEPEILIVDEVLAVGDAQFQKKCLGKLEEAGEEGKTVLFVSHQMAAVEKLCRKGILLNQGKIQYIGSQTKAIAKYLTTDTDNTVSLESREDRIGSGEVRVFSIDVKDNEGNLLDVSQSGQDISINLHFKKISSFRSEHLIASISVKNQLEVPVFLQHNRLTGDAFGQLPATGVLVCQINNLPLPPSSYRISYSLIQDGAYLDSLSDATDLTVVDGDFYGSGEVPPVTHGVCLIDASWHIKS